MILCSASAITDSPRLIDQLAAIETEMDYGQPAFPTLIKLFSTLKYFHSRFECFEFLSHVNESDSDSVEEPSHLSKLRSVMAKYHTCIVSFYTNSPHESLKAVRLYGDFEFAFLFTRYIRNKLCMMNDSDSPCLTAMQDPFYRILKCKDMKKFKNRNFSILGEYEGIARIILDGPFGAESQGLPETPKDPKANNDGSRDAVIDWEERKKILEEIILSIRSLNIFARHLTADMSNFLNRVKCKIVKLEFIVKNFQVDSQGPNVNHFISLFYQLQGLVQNVKRYEQLSPKTRKLLSLFKIYWYHLIRNQMTDPLLFPKKVLALVSRSRNMRQRRIFKFLQLPTNVSLKKSVQYLREEDIFNILWKKEGQISQIHKVETNSDGDILDLGRGVWNNLLTHRDIIIPYEQWVIKTYLILQNETASKNKFELTFCKSRVWRRDMNSFHNIYYGPEH
jgi:hypothetical protein